DKRVSSLQAYWPSTGLAVILRRTIGWPGLEPLWAKPRSHDREAPGLREALQPRPLVRTEWTTNRRMASVGRTGKNHADDPLPQAAARVGDARRKGIDDPRPVPADVESDDGRVQPKEQPRSRHGV